MAKNDPYQNLLKRTHEISLLKSAASLLSWDEETYAPPAAIDHRSEQLAYLAGKAHTLFTSPEVGEWLATCEEEKQEDRDPIRTTNLREWRRSYQRATCLPTSLVEEINKTTSLARSVWIDARAKKQFNLFEKDLKKIIDLNRRCADLWGFEESPYDALLEEYEPGAKTSQIKKLFEELRPTLTAIVADLSEKSKTVPPDLLKGSYPIEKQQSLNRRIAEAIGFDFQGGRIDTTTHPFCTELGPRDCRLTTRYDETDFTSSLYGVLHEAGHGIYAQGLPPEHFGTPAGDAVSLGIHESQSRLWENLVGRDLSFWEYWHPVACEYFPELKAFSPRQITRAVNRVTPSFVRVEADEVTYDLHIILRFKTEIELIEGRLDVGDLPAFWNEHFEDMLGLKVPDDSMGCLQDIHWSLGSFGYFPTYTLGNLNAAQLFRKAQQAVPDLDTQLAQGQYHGLLGWLNTSVHQPGQRYRPQELMEHVTGEKTQTGYHFENLRRKEKLFDAS